MPEMLIGGEWRAASAHEEHRGRQPRHRGDGRRRAGRLGRRRRAAVAAAKRAFAEWSATDVEKRAAILAKAADLIHEHAKALAADADVRAGQADGRGDRRGQPPRPRRALLRRGGDQGPRRLPGAAVHAGPVLRPGDPPPDGRVRRDHALQLPAHAARHEGRARARERATRWSPSRRRRRRSPRSRSRGCSPRPACPTACSTSSPAAGSEIGDALVSHPDVRRVAFTGSTDGRAPHRRARRARTSSGSRSSSAAPTP